MDTTETKAVKALIENFREMSSYFDWTPSDKAITEEFLDDLISVIN